MQMKELNRVFLIVLDSFGIGEMPDAVEFGDVGSNTLASIAKSTKYHTPMLQKLGLFNIDGVTVGEKESCPLGSFARMKEASRGKDTTIGHWEIAGVISHEPLPTYPNGFPEEVMEEFEKQTGRKTLCNLPYSGTEVIAKYGKEHVDTSALIVYTSADSVFQIAAHEDIVPIDELYRYCEIARNILHGKHGVGRVIARPFTGVEGDYKRTSNRHDFSLVPPKDTMLDQLIANGFSTYGVGKIYDIFAGKGIQHTQRIKNNTEGMDRTLELQKEDFKGLCFVNLVDFDMTYGHRRDIDGYAQAATEFDVQLETFMNNMRDDDVLMITADHGCDPGYTGTDHTREHTPFLIYGKQIKGNHSMGTRDSFADIAATVLELLGVENNTDGKSVASQVLN
jgi:phosphopentomutase